MEMAVVGDHADDVFTSGKAIRIHVRNDVIGGSVADLIQIPVLIAAEAFVIRSQLLNTHKDQVIYLLLGSPCSDDDGLTYGVGGLVGLERGGDGGVGGIRFLCFGLIRCIGIYDGDDDLGHAKLVISEKAVICHQTKDVFTGREAVGIHIRNDIVGHTITDILQIPVLIRAKTGIEPPIHGLDTNEYAVCHFFFSRRCRDDNGLSHHIGGLVRSQSAYLLK